jgi:hypothetical protein
MSSQLAESTMALHTPIPTPPLNAPQTHQSEARDALGGALKQPCSGERPVAVRIANRLAALLFGWSALKRRSGRSVSKRSPLSSSRSGASMPGCFRSFAERPASSTASTSCQPRRLHAAAIARQPGRFHERQLRDVACPAGRQGTGRVGGRALRHACSLTCRAAGRVEAGRAVCLFKGGCR